VGQSIQETSQASTELLTAAQDLSKLSVNLQSEVGVFIDALRDG